MPVDVVTTTEELAALAPEWNRLLATSDSDAVQLTHEWMLSWWKSFGAPARLWTLLVRNHRGALIGIAPMMRSPWRYRGLSVERVSLLANGHSPSCDIIAGPGELEGVVNAVFDHFAARGGWDVLDLHKLREDGPSCAAIMTRLRARYAYGVKKSIDSPVVAVNTDWTTFLRSRSGKFRKVLRNKVNRADRAGDITIEHIPISGSGHPALADMVAVSAKSWKRSVGGDLGSNGRSRKFHLLLADALGPRGAVRLWLLRKGGIPAAFEYHLVYRNTVYPIRADYDESFRDLSPGSVLEQHILKSCCEDPAISEYYSCGDDYRYLLNWTGDIRRHVNVEIFNRKTLPAGLHAFEYRLLPVLRRLHITSLARRLRCGVRGEVRGWRVEVKGGR